MCGKIGRRLVPSGIQSLAVIGLFDPNPMGGSIMLYAGWQVDGEPDGAPNDGYTPVPVQLLRAVVHDPELAYSLSSALHRPSIEWQSASSDR